MALAPWTKPQASAMAAAPGTGVVPVLRLASIEKWVSDTVAKVTRQHKEQKAHYISRLLYESYLLLRPHKGPLAYSPILHYSAVEQFFFGSAFASRALRTNLGGSHGEYWKYLQPFWDFEEDNRGYDQAHGATKVYLLNDGTVRTLDDHWRSDEAAAVVDRETDRPLTVGDLPMNGICHSSHSPISIRPFVTFDRVRLDGIIQAEEVAIKTGVAVGERRRRVLGLRYLYVVRKWTLSFGGLPNLYQDYKPGEAPATGNGRLQGVGGIHLQSLPRYARRLIYAGSGWHDFDFKACHLSILHSLCAAYGLDTPALDDYVADKGAVDALLADEIEVPVGKIKRVINALIYDTSLANTPHSSLHRLLGSDGIDRLQSSFYYRWLSDDLKAVRSQIVDRHRHANVIRNAVGKERSVEVQHPSTGRITSVPIRKLLSHVLTGYESWALDLVCRGADDLVVLMFDGWVSENDRDVGAIEDLIEVESVKQFGFPLHLRLKSHRY